MQLVDVGNVESDQTPRASLDWSDLGRLVRCAAISAVAMHFAELAAADDSVSHDGSQVEPVIR